MTEPPRIRISDEDRHQYADRLRVAYGEGRITEVELEDRLRHVYEARFESELAAVASDLPVPADTSAVQPVTSIHRSRGMIRVIRSMAQWYFPAIICTGIWAITSFGNYFWPIWVFFGLTIPFISSLIFDDDNDNDNDDDDASTAGEDQT